MKNFVYTPNQNREIVSPDKNPNLAKDIDDSVLKTLREICENCNYFNLNKVDNKQLNIFVKSLRSLIDDYWDLEM